jgi:hypothetical protein
VGTLVAAALNPLDVAITNHQFPLRQDCRRNRCADALTWGNWCQVLGWNQLRLS